MEYNDLKKADQETVQSQTGITAQQLKDENPYFIAEYHFAEAIVEQFCDMYDLPSEARIYLDSEHLAREWGMDYTEVTINGTDYRFRSW